MPDQRLSGVSEWQERGPFSQKKPHLVQPAALKALMASSSSAKS